MLVGFQTEMSGYIDFESLKKQKYMWRFLAKLYGYKYYLSRKDRTTVFRVSDNYGFHSEAEFFTETGETNWHNVWVKKLIF